MTNPLARWLDSDIGYSFRTSPMAVVAGVIAFVCIFCAMFAPWVSPHDPFNLATLELSDARLPPAWSEGGNRRYLLGTDDQTEDDIKRLVDFLLEIELDLAEFTVLTPFPHTKTYDDLLRENRIIDTDWNNYNAGKVVYQPKHMSPERMLELYRYAWDTFYKDESQNEKMGRLFQHVVMREIADGTYVRPRKDLAQLSFGKEISRSKNN